MFDVAIVGAGPAGSTLARLIGTKRRVLLLEKRHCCSSEGGFSSDKCCGGLLAPDAQKMLATLGLGLPQSVLVGPQLFSVRTIDFPAAEERFYQRHYINVDRKKFDGWLLSLLPAGVDFRSGCRVQSIEPSEREIKIHFTHNQKNLTESARVLVGADGAYSSVRSLAFLEQPPPELYIAIQESVRVTSPLPYFCAIFDPAITDFYGWTIPKEDLLLVGAALLRNDRPREKFELLKKKLSSFGFRLGTVVRRTGAFLARPRRQKQLCAGHGRVALIGEAGGWISPSSAEGLSYALESARALAEAMLDSSDGGVEQYRRRMKSLRNNIFLKNLKAPFLYQPWIRKLVMKSGLRSLRQPAE
jgi:geranylgeranyl diphosphate/geranylgeranyl-bacteriochlorophyllide a reductase